MHYSYSISHGHTPHRTIKAILEPFRPIFLDSITSPRISKSLIDTVNAQLEFFIVRIRDKLFLGLVFSQDLRSLSSLIQI